MSFDKYSEISDETIRSYYCNATVTCSEALGHSKARSNKHRADHWHEVLVERGVKTPSSAEVSELGEFNGRGSFGR